MRIKSKFSRPSISGPSIDLTRRAFLSPVHWPRLVESQLPSIDCQDRACGPDGGQSNRKTELFWAVTSACPQGEMHSGWTTLAINKPPITKFKALFGTNPFWTRTTRPIDLGKETTATTTTTTAASSSGDMRGGIRIESGEEIPTFDLHTSVDDQVSIGHSVIGPMSPVACAAVACGKMGRSATVIATRSTVSLWRPHILACAGAPGRQQRQIEPRKKICSARQKRWTQLQVPRPIRDMHDLVL